jgi:hypothetical protein
MTIDVIGCLISWNLKLDLLAAQCRRGGQRRNLVKRTCQLFDGFDKGRARQGPLSGFAPQSGSFFDQASLSAVTRQNLGLVLSNVETSSKLRPESTWIRRIIWLAFVEDDATAIGNPSVSIA